MESFYKKIEEIIKKDDRYSIDAYEFVMRSLWFTQAKLKRPGHLTGKELLGGIKEFILEQYGPMAKHVLNHWGIENTEDFGEIVFNMVGSGLLNKTEEDSLDDFRDVFDFEEALDVFRDRNFEKLGSNAAKRSQIKPQQKKSASKPSAGTQGSAPKNLN